jgi:hypothetical protein
MISGSGLELKLGCGLGSISAILLWNTRAPGGTFTVDQTVAAPTS